MRIIIVGAGNVGFYIAQRLTSEDKDVVVIDKNWEVLSRVAHELDVEAVHGSGSSPRILDKAGVRQADIFLAVTDSDEINLVACTFCNLLAPNPIKVARVRNTEYLEYQDILARELMPIDIIVNPEQEVVSAIERLMSAPEASEINEFSDVNIKMVGIWVKKESNLMGLDLAQLKQRIGIEGFIVAAIVRDQKTIIPTGKDVIREGDLIYFVCAQKDLSTALLAFGSRPRIWHKVFIIGGGNIGIKLAQALEQQKGTHVKIMDRDRQRCDYLAENLNKSIVLEGDGTEQKLLLEENIGDMDVVVAVTSDEESNVLASLLAKNLGAKLTITRVNKLAYLPLMQTIGLEHVVSPRLAAANTILRFIRQGTVISSITIKEDAEALEIIAQKSSFLVNKPIKHIDFPKGAIILCLIRGEEVIIPSGDSIIHPHDRVVILAKSKTISQLEKALSVQQRNN